MSNIRTKSLLQLQRFGLISEIIPEQPETWLNRVFITLDVDWAPDFVVREVVESLELLGVPATWFVTHASDACKELEHRNDSEVGAHPDFTRLLRPDRGDVSLESIISAMRDITPSATSFRCHALVQSSQILAEMERAGFRHDCNVFLPFAPIDALEPWKHSALLTRIPYCWEDDTWLLGLCRAPQELVGGAGMKVIDVHPIHLWLNCETLERYEHVKKSMNDESLLRASRNQSVKGVGDVFRETIEAIQAQDDQ
ncbi:MAG: hypothetical protein EBX92_07405 [Actinobacteria bacterium]|nr:hypothetical protein [Actinomycetota bacterium]